MARFAGVIPEAIVLCDTPEDVTETIQFAKREPLDIAVRGGGHSGAGRSSTTGIVIDVSPMSSVVVDRDRVTVGAGARLADLFDALAEHGMTTCIASDGSAAGRLVPGSHPVVDQLNHLFSI